MKRGTIYKRANIHLLKYYLNGKPYEPTKSSKEVSEIQNLSWSQVDLDQGIVRLEAGETKNDECRTLYLDEELREFFNRQWEDRKKSGKLIPAVRNMVSAAMPERVG